MIAGIFGANHDGGTDGDQQPGYSTVVPADPSYELYTPASDGYGSDSVPSDDVPYPSDYPTDDYSVPDDPDLDTGDPELDADVPDYGDAGGGDAAETSEASTGATALCNDGTESYAQHHQGACSHHGGVAIFYR